MSLSPALIHGLLAFLYCALTLTSAHSLWHLLPEPGFAWSMGLALVPGLVLMAFSRLLRPQGPRAISPLEWVLLVNALLLWAVIALQELPGTTG